MYVVCVDIHVESERLEAFIRATLDNARHTRAEAGNRRFDVLQVADDPTHFLLHEAYDARTPSPATSRPPLPAVARGRGALDGPAAVGPQVRQPLLWRRRGLSAKEPPRALATAAAFVR